MCVSHEESSHRDCVKRNNSSSSGSPTRRSGRADDSSWPRFESALSCAALASSIVVSAWQHDSASSMTGDRACAALVSVGSNDECALDAPVALIELGLHSCTPKISRPSAVSVPVLSKQTSLTCELHDKKYKIFQNQHGRAHIETRIKQECCIPCRPWRFGRATCKTRQCARATGWPH